MSETTAPLGPGVVPEGSAPQATGARAPAAVTPPKGGKLVAWLGFAFGSLLSIGGNILYTWTPSDPMPAGWQPTIWAQIGAAAWSVALLLSVEVLSRVQWPAHWTWKVARYGGVGVVALGSAIISYGHLNHVLTEWNYGPVGAAVGPIVIDGLMVVCGFALLAGPEILPEPAKTQVSTVPGAGKREVETLPAPAKLRPDQAFSGRPEDQPPVEPTPAPKPRTRPARKSAKAPAIEELVDEARPLVANGAGRPTLMKELGIKDNQARQLLDVIRSEPTVNGKAIH